MNKQATDRVDEEMEIKRKKSIFKQLIMKLILFHLIMLDVCLLRVNTAVYRVKITFQSFYIPQISEREMLVKIRK